MTRLSEQIRYIALDAPDLPNGTRTRLHAIAHDMEQREFRMSECLSLALGQLECVRENLSKGMSKSIQALQSNTIKETINEIRNRQNEK